MKYENVKFVEDARNKIIDGVNLIVDAIQVSYGPQGHQVAIANPNGVKLTKDGATIALAVNDKDPYVQMGIELIRNVSKATADSVGDGSSTVAILAREIINRYRNCEEDPTALWQKLQSKTNRILARINEKKLEISSKEDLVKVATLSANNNAQIGQIIADAYEKVGRDGLVTFEESEEIADRVEYTNGFRIESGYASPYFINTPKGECILEDVFVYVSDAKMEEVKEVVALADKAMKMKKSLLLVAPGFDSEIYIFLKANLDLLKSCTVITPNYRNYRQVMTSDIRDIIGKECICQKVICTNKYTTFIGCDSDKEAIDKKVEELRATVAEKAVSPFDLEFAKKRLANFTSGIATIKVGGWSQTEIGSKMDLYEDAINSTHQALIGGVVPGGGKALSSMIELRPNDYAFDCNEYGPFGEVLYTPTRLLQTETETWDDMIEKGIIEPFNTCKTTLENAVSIACQILSCDCAIIAKYDTNF